MYYLSLVGWFLMGLGRRRGLLEGHLLVRLVGACC